MFDEVGAGRGEERVRGEDAVGVAEDRTTDTVRRLTGRPPRSFRAFAERELASSS